MQISLIRFDRQEEFASQEECELFLRTTASPDELVAEIPEHIFPHASFRLKRLHVQDRLPKATPRFNEEIWELTLEGSQLPTNGMLPFDALRIKGIPLHPHTHTALANGYQCWSESPILSEADCFLSEPFPDRTMFGDSEFYSYATQPGCFHSWSFSYTDVENQALQPLFAALDEDLFFTAWEFDLPAGTVAIYMDTEGADLAHIAQQKAGSLRLGAWLVPDPHSEVALPLSDAAAVWMELIRRYERVPRALSQQQAQERCKRVGGYTSWYYHYQNISERLLLENLEHIKNKTDWQIFQIDDGYQNKVGDWLTPAAGFPAGVQRISEQAHTKGLKPGIWCAPFIVLESSDIVREQPEWLLRDAQGEPVLCGIHTLWGGKFFALDSEHPGVKKYVTDILKTFFSDWKFSFLKADFLYATARRPASGLTRAQRSARAHQFLYEICLQHNAYFLSCGATLPSAYGRCDYSRIGADIAFEWENSEHGRLPSRETIGTRRSLNNTLTRSLLNGVMFGNDPDVFLLRDEHQTMTEDQRATLAHINTLLGSLVFCSDDLSRYSTWQQQQLESLAQLKKALPNQIKVSSVKNIWQNSEAGKSSSDLFKVEFANIPFTLHANLSTEKHQDFLPCTCLLKKNDRNKTQER